MAANIEHNQQVLPNPDSLCPTEILEQQVRLRVDYLGFDGAIHQGIIEVNTLVATEVSDFFEQALALKFPIEKVVAACEDPYHWDDDLLMADNTSSGFNYRPIAGTTTLSQHSRGLAFDINTRLNPYIRFVDGHEIVAPEDARWQPDIPGTLTADHPLVQLMIDYGWEWGGNWTKDYGMIDYQHFQKNLPSLSFASKD